MIKTYNKINDVEIQLLKGFIGRKLNNIKHDPFIFTPTSYGVVYLTIDDLLYSITDFYESVKCLDFIEDISVLKINDNITEVKSYLKDTKLITENINQKINSISVINGKLSIKKNNESFSFEDTYGIIFTLEDDYQFAFEKDDFGESITIYRGYNLFEKFKYLKDDFEKEAYDISLNPSFEFNIINLK